MKQVVVLLSLLLGAAASHAQSLASYSLASQWQSGLAGVKLTAYSGSVISSNSTLTVVRFCSNGRYHYYKEGSWSSPGVAGGASNNSISGRWSIRESGFQVLLDYVTDQGEKGSFPIFLQNNGRVNIGGTAFAAERGAAGC